VRVVTIDPTTWGLPRAAPADLRGGDVRINVAVARQLLPGNWAGQGRGRAECRAGLATHAGLTGDLTADLAGGVERATASLESGAAGSVLDRWVSLGSRLATG